MLRMPRCERPSERGTIPHAVRCPVVGYMMMCGFVSFFKESIVVSLLERDVDVCEKSNS
jgi:hypothetical protein